MQARSLQASRYAPRTPAQNAAITREQRLKEDKDKARRLLARLQWKAESLAVSYTRALEISHNPNVLSEGRYIFINNVTAEHAENMFKVDFFEFYTLLERYLTLCLSIFGITISGTAPPMNINALRLITNPEAMKHKLQSTHQFHANLLDALDDPTNPLQPALGHQDIRIQLGLAKDYRNRWKDVDEKSRDAWDEEDERKKLVRLEDLGLGDMVRVILVGCEQALGIVFDKTEGRAANGYGDFGVIEMDDAPLEYMGDAMELD
ncbi:hypothetical protein M011DRAFT_494769 [Sporormia fimetaria CBS 119925]|uniref:Uncharacterized protein n=1 Tax=Sporormia fimetaria CBS 119925 TaxID=1340428 RepID=A0A6A6V8L8_9PLEO|nr:hypothetical protein M011DRAFT_494769 [Sporormia fimetaria CBS 119925]